MNENCKFGTECKDGMSCIWQGKGRPGACGVAVHLTGNVRPIHN